MALIVVDFNNLGPELRKIRKSSRGLNQTEISDKAGFSLKHYSEIERGKDCKLSDMESIAAAMGVKLAVVIAVDENDLKRLLDANL